MPSKNWGRYQKNWGETPAAKAGIEHKVMEEKNLREKLEKKSMSELRTYVKEHNLKARDTSKDELVEEIIKEVK